MKNIIIVIALAVCCQTHLIAGIQGKLENLKKKSEETIENGKVPRIPFLLTRELLESEISSEDQLHSYADWVVSTVKESKPSLLMSVVRTLAISKPEMSPFMLEAIMKHSPAHANQVLKEMMKIGPGKIEQLLILAIESKHVSVDTILAQLSLLDSRKVQSLSRKLLTHPQSHPANKSTLYQRLGIDEKAGVEEGVHAAVTRSQQIHNVANLYLDYIRKNKSGRFIGDRDEYNRISEVVASGHMALITEEEREKSQGVVLRIVRPDGQVIFITISSGEIIDLDPERPDKRDYGG